MAGGSYRAPISASHYALASRFLLLLTALPLALAALAFVLQWRGGVDDPLSRWPSADSRGFPGMDNSPTGSSSPAHPLVASSAASDCTEILGGSSSPSFPYFRGWRFAFESDPKPKIADMRHNKHFGRFRADLAVVVLPQSPRCCAILPVCRGEGCETSCFCSSRIDSWCQSHIQN